jgi:hypothetical protein
MPKVTRYILSPLLAAALVASCTNEGYDTGDGRWSYYTADFALAHTAEATSVDYAVTDEGDTVWLSPHATVAWATTPDSLYRALLYYNKVTEGTTSAFALRSVPVLVPSVGNDTITSDPVTLQSAWVSTLGRWLNLGLLLKTGVADSIDNVQVIGVYNDTLSSSSQPAGTYCLELRHDQNNVPQYYSSRVYVSIPLDSIPTGATIRLSVPTYSGTVTRTFVRP